jgi:hypothetical protein
MPKLAASNLQHFNFLRFKCQMKSKANHPPRSQDNHAKSQTFGKTTLPVKIIFLPLL